MPQQMLVHKGGQINNVQLITGVGSAGSGWMWTKNWSFCENPKKIGGGGGGGGVGLGGGQGGCEHKDWNFCENSKKKTHYNN